MRNEKLFFAFIISFFLIFAKPLFAQSTYVLPYPSFMPGSKMYVIHLLWDELMRYWYFGNFGQFDYNLKQSDKYLIEAKTLFEYKQYLLGYKALQKSDDYFLKLVPALEHAREQAKDISGKKIILESASLKHIEVVTLIKQQVPREFLWQPEKDRPSYLDLHKALESSIKSRQQQL